MSCYLHMFIAGVIGLKYRMTDPGAAKDLPIVCVEDGREMHSVEQLREHLAMGHKEMWLMREENDSSDMALALNADRISPLISKLTTGDLEKNILAWSKNVKLSFYLEVCQASGCSSRMLMINRLNNNVTTVLSSLPLGNHLGKSLSGDRRLQQVFHVSGRYSDENCPTDAS